MSQNVKREKMVKNRIWCNYGWKLPELELGNRYPSTGNTESQTRQTKTST